MAKNSIKMEMSDKSFEIKADKIEGNTFISHYHIDLEQYGLNTFWKRLKWLLIGKI